MNTTAKARGRKAAPSGGLVIPDVTGLADQRDIAKAYTDAGLPVIPWRVARDRKGRKTKASAREGFKFNDEDIAETSGDIDGWWNNWLAGFACSWRTGLIVLDIDYPDRFAVSDFPEVPDSVTVRTGRAGGYHHYLDFRHLRGKTSPKDWPRQGNIPGGQIKSNGFVAAPGSRHPNGNLYEVDGDCYEVARGSLKLLRSLAAYRLRNGRTGRKVVSGEPGRAGYLDELWLAALEAGDSEQHSAVLALVQAWEEEASNEVIRTRLFPMLLKELPSYDGYDPWDMNGLSALLHTNGGRPYFTPSTQQYELAEMKADGPNASVPPEEDAFWNSREELTRIRQWAQAQMVSPWALLAEVIAEVIARVPPTFVLPNLIGGHGSLNMLLAITGDSAAGKGGAASMVGDVLRVDEPLAPDGKPFRDMIPKREQVGSGEGLAENYGFTKDRTVIRTAFTSIVTAYEVSTLEALMGRGSATIGGELKKFYMGEPLGFGYKGPRRIPIERYTYRGVLTAGVQPEMSGVIVNDYASGWSQRWMFFHANDPYAPSPDERPERPEPVKWSIPRELQELGLDTDSLSAGKYRAVAEVCDKAVDEIKSIRLPGLRGTLSRTEKLKGHRLYTQEKFALGLGLLNGRMDLSEGDWDLAAYAMRRSDEIRKLCEREVWNANRRKARAEGSLDGYRQSAAETTKDRESSREIWKLILGWITDDKGKTANQLRKLMPRHYAEVDGALREMVAAKALVTEKRPYNQQTYTYYVRPRK